MSDEAKMNKSKELERYKNDLLITNRFNYFMSSLVVILILLTIIAFIQLSLNRLTLRYPLSSYQVFNSEVN